MRTRKDILSAIEATYQLSELETDGILVCENGDCRVAICYRDRGDYVGAVWIERNDSLDCVWYFEGLHAPQILTQGSPLQNGYDSTEALEHMAQSAMSFADHDTSGAGGESECEEWNRYGEEYSNAAHGERDDDGPIFTAVTR